MKQLEYARLLKQMCEHLGLPDAATLLETGLLRVGGYDLLLHYDEMSEPDVIQARLDMGALDKDQREWMWYRLLVSNFEWGANGTVGWSLTPEGDHVTVTAQYPFDVQTTGAALAGWLRNLVACTEAYWRVLPSQQPVADILSLVSLQRVVLPAQPQAASWEALIEALCTHVGLTERDHLLNNGQMLAVDGVDMLLRHDKAAAGRFEVRIDLGMDIVTSRETLWQGLLWNNFVVGLTGRVLFSVHPDRDAVVLTLQQDLPAEVNAEDFVELLQAIAGNAKNFWSEARAALGRAEAALQKGPPHSGASKVRQKSVG
jgi:hypothetical protein